MAAKIGIKLADGSFLPIMDEDVSASETLELTTVRDDQSSVQINLFKKEDDADPAYIGSLIVEDIQTKAAGDPTIELRLSLDENKNLSAEAVDKDSGSHQTLRTSLETFNDQTFSDFDLDFDLSDEAGEGDFSASSEESSADNSQDFSAALLYSDSDDEENVKKRKKSVWLILLLVLLGIAALVIGVLLITKQTPQADVQHVTMRNEEEMAAKPPVQPIKEPQPAEAKPAAETQKPDLPPDTKALEPPAPAEPAVVEQIQPAQSEPAVQPEAEKSASSTALPVTVQEAFRYKIRRGDTLWDLSETFYRTPWLYKKIARHNHLKNPDVIFPGTYIEIPPQ